MLNLHTELGAGILARSHPTCGCASCREALGRLLGADALLFVAPTFPLHGTDGPKPLPAAGTPRRWHVRLGAAAVTVGGCRHRQRLLPAGERELHREEGKPQDLGSGEGTGESKARKRKVDEGGQASCWGRPYMQTTRSNLPLSHTGSFLIKSLQKPSLQFVRQRQRAACTPNASVSAPG